MNNPRLNICAVLAILLVACGNKGPEPLFRDISVESGLAFTHVNGMSGKFYIAEIMGSGCALFDFDNDGDLDIYLVQSGIPQPDEATVSWSSGAPRGDRLFRNDLEPGKPPKFVDITEQAGIKAEAYGMGVTAGDYNLDGFVDLYVSNYGRNYLYHNNGDGTFSDVTDISGTQDSRWSVTAVFTDVNNDRLPDLYIANYLAYTWEKNKECFNAGPDYCNPLTYGGEPDKLLLNKGDGTFEDISHTSGLAEIAANSLGVVASDLNNDGLVDLYVACDGQANLFWLNMGDNTFKENALMSGCALNVDGHPEASMGIDAADFDGDGDDDLFMTHLAGETNTLYVNNGDGRFSDRSIQTRLANPSKAYTGFGTAWFDYDNDGFLDTFTANGAVTTIDRLVDAGDPYPLHQTNQLFRNLDGKTFVETTVEAGPVFELSEVSRGSAFGDIDNDGDTDILVTNNNGPVRLLENTRGNSNPWLGLTLKDKHVVISGARVGLELQDQTTLWRRARIEASYASACSPRILFGLGQQTKILGLVVHWPDGAMERWPALPISNWHTLTRGTGQSIEP